MKELGLKPGDRVGIYARNREEWMTTELALASQSCVTVAIYDTLGPDTISYCVNHADLKIVFCDAPKVAGECAASPRSRLVERIPSQRSR
jgi:long-chain acyl-CoA synthetase